MEKCFHPNSKCFTVIGKKKGLYYQERYCIDCKRIVGSMRNIKGSKTYIEDMRSLFPDIKFVSKKRIIIILFLMILYILLLLSIPYLPEINLN